MTLPLSRDDIRARQRCHGMTDDAAAAELGVPVRSYRAWIGAAASYARRAPAMLTTLVCAIEFIRACGLYDEWREFRARHEGAGWVPQNSNGDES